MEQDRKLIMVIGASLVMLFSGCHTLKNCGCDEMPQLPVPRTHHWVKNSMMSIDLSDTKGWEHRTTYAQIALIDSGDWSGVDKSLRIDTFGLHFPPCQELDTLLDYWKRVFTEPALGPVRTDVYCDSLNNRIGIVECIFESKGTYQRQILGYRIVNGLDVQLNCIVSQPIAMGPSPPEMRLRVLRWMSDIRAVEQ